MRTKLQPWHLVAAVLLTCAGVLAVLSWARGRIATPAAMLACLPRTGAVTVYLDVDGLRRSGILDLIAGSKSTEDLEYQSFVEGTGFDYRRDLESLAGAFSGRNSHLVLRGNFDWKRLRAYTVAQGGKCNNSVCRVRATNGRFISYYPLRSKIMAISISNDEWGALDISQRTAPDGAPGPDQPIWLSVSGPALRDVSGLPSGARSFVSPLESADNIVVSVGPAENRLKVNLKVDCPSETSANELLNKLQGATNMLRKLLAREHEKPNPRDLSGILVGGEFHREGTRVIGGWPMPRDFVEAIASGSVD